MASHVFKYLLRVDTSSSLSVPEGPDSGLYARESYFQRLEGQQDSGSITFDPERLSLVVCPYEYASILTRNERLPSTSSTGQRG
jgi:hypothetical protein